jgi:transcriptional regulator with XRE-family HTH domain
MQKRTGILRSYLSRVENGHTVPSLATLQRLASAMGVTLADFFSGDGDGAVAASAGGADGSSEYLVELRNYLPQLSPQQRQELLDMVKDMAQTVRRS